MNVYNGASILLDRKFCLFVCWLFYNHLQQTELALAVTDLRFNNVCVRRGPAMTSHGSLEPKKQEILILHWLRRLGRLSVQSRISTQLNSTQSYGSLPDC
jgi:hypothetical protein